MQWYWVDLLILGVIALSVLTGLIRGFVKELVAICVWAIAIWVAWHYSSVLDPWLQNWIQDKTARMVASFILILLSCLVIGGLVNALLGLLLKKTGLSGTDRLLGMGFGLVRGVFIIGLIMVAVKLTSLPYEEYARESRLYAKFDPLVDWLGGKMPEFISQAKALELEKGPVATPTPVAGKARQVIDTQITGLSTLERVPVSSN
ncbi:CvpA family protein [Legionella sp. CNM-4043-24]|uniref:CvpA family protein n=1 Tax=Legionella sp. CNM-4043-24 TaxID=3421646 RepID=UPI00403A89BA